jgi:hypothetical protein
VRLIVLVLALLALPSMAVAQTHPCDQSAPTTQTVTTSAQHKVQFCAKPVDVPEAFTVYTNGTASDLRALTLVVAPNALGYALYEGPKNMTFPAGTVILELTLWNREYSGGPSQESARSSPLSLTGVVGNPVPTAPAGLRVVR